MDALRQALGGQGVIGCPSPSWHELDVDSTNFYGRSPRSQEEDFLFSEQPLWFSISCGLFYSLYKFGSRMTFSSLKPIFLNFPITETPPLLVSSVDQLPWESTFSYLGERAIHVTHESSVGSARSSPSYSPVEYYTNRLAGRLTCKALHVTTTMWRSFLGTVTKPRPLSA